MCKFIPGLNGILLNIDVKVDLDGRANIDERNL